MRARLGLLLAAVLVFLAATTIWRPRNRNHPPPQVQRVPSQAAIGPLAVTQLPWSCTHGKTVCMTHHPSHQVNIVSAAYLRPSDLRRSEPTAL